VALNTLFESNNEIVPLFWSAVKAFIFAWEAQGKPSALVGQIGQIEEGSVSGSS
jgi:hypothetical protein